MEHFGAQAKPLLGGTDLMVRIQKGQVEPAAVVDLKRVLDIGDRIEIEGATANIGARVVLSDLVRDERIRKTYPALVEAASIVGSIQIRNRATLAGNICNASPAADTVPPLLVYAAAVEVATSDPAEEGAVNRRQVPLRDFFLGPGKTVCSPPELVVAVHIPVPQPPFGSAFGRLTRRRGVDLATINMACSIDAGGITTFAFGAVGPTPILARDESGELADRDLPQSKRDELLQSLLESTSPISDVRSGKEYRQAMLLTIGRRVLQQAQERRQTQTG
jgi:CO/xanthine dehydrogenase FAD-binding subunit